jgi:predicted regulator of Ras-like GTPase activity (Roadblock/LC7/MglB family)
MSPPPIKDMSPRETVEETVQRLATQKGVTGVLICNLNGVPIRYTMKDSDSGHWAGIASQLAIKARQSVKACLPNGDTEELQYIRLRTKTTEIIIAPDFSAEHVLVVLQHPEPRD